MKKYIDFMDHDPGNTNFKTRLWHVVTLNHGFPIGKIKWYGPWRGYAFFPNSTTVFDKNCLQQIADFLSEKTSDHYKNLKNGESKT